MVTRTNSRLERAVHQDTGEEFPHASSIDHRVSWIHRGFIVQRFGIIASSPGTGGQAETERSSQENLYEAGKRG